MRLIDYFDRGADLFPDRHCPLGGVKAPKSVDFIAALPLSLVGKVQKKTLREPCWAGRERQI